MKKFLLAILFSVFCTNSYADCTPGDIDCETTRDDVMRLCIGDEVRVKCDGSLMDLCEVKCEPYYKDLQKCTTITAKPTLCFNIGHYCDHGNVYIYHPKTKKTYKPMKENDTCQKTGTEIAKCKYNKNYGQDVLSCTAEKCKEPAYRLWFHNGNSMGTCYTEKDAQSYCRNPKYCKEKNCDPTYEDNKTHYGRKIKAFVGCHKQEVPDVQPQPGIPEQPNYVPTQPTQPIQHLPPAGTPQGEPEIAEINVPVPSIPDDDTQPIQPLPPAETPQVEPEIAKINVPVPSIPDDDTPNIIVGAPVCTTEKGCKPVDPDAIFQTIDSDLAYYFAEGSSSVWKNDEGKFNTARLVSDSVAGVVLGTVGGVVTSQVIKKNQIKNGFQDLKCTIGGQTVATYGDEFRVGVK